MGGAVAELLGEQDPLPLLQMGMQDRFGESGTPDELLEYFQPTAPHVAAHARRLLERKAQLRNVSAAAVGD